jgi:RNase P/RNase MRP subunit POP5
MKEFRHRYIAFTISDPDRTRPSKSSLIEAIVGRLRSARERPSGFRFRLIEYDSALCKGIVKTIPHTATGFMKSLLVSVNEICGARTAIHILGTSGTLKALRSKYCLLGNPTKNNNSVQSDISSERDEPAVPL